MARSRNIKPSFFHNEYLADLPPHARLLFIGLWCLADREGRLEDRPKRIKAEVLPYEKVDVDALLNALENSCEHFILRYETHGDRYIQIQNFAKHQTPHIKECASTIPAPCLTDTSTGISDASTSQESLIPDSLNLIPDSFLQDVEAKPPAPAKPKQQPEKKPYGENSNVMLTDDQFEKLQMYGTGMRERYIERLDGYIQQIGRPKAAAKYKDHYATIQNWIRRDNAGDGPKSKPSLSAGYQDTRTKDYTEGI